MKETGVGLLAGCFLRSYFIAAAYNPHGLQNIGFLYAMEPALLLLHDPGESLRRARLRYAYHHNCHPCFTPMLLGIFLRMEAEIAAGMTEPTLLENVKDTTANTLSAIGDSLFNGALLGMWAISAAVLILAELPGTAFGLTLAGLVLFQVFKLLTFILGLKKGMSALSFMSRLNLMNKVDHLKMLNAVLLVLFLWLALPGADLCLWGYMGLALTLSWWAVGKVHVPRFLVALVLLALVGTLFLAGWFDGLTAH